MKNRKNTMPVLPWRRRVQARRDASLQRTVDPLQATHEMITAPVWWEPIQVRVVEGCGAPSC